ncbi:glycosyltransferase [Acinetobacter rongchengensis]|uniref:Glycosyltransferase n=1 Tax=Acinetobacter rongchengensis TaxID=2419601 RepID=A0A3A8EX89_9GAMM|nr:glycosyltransferase [Acinetobacter rongchengensis]RKG38056.1 glycosyltransferase [Acinetobacter rongchengensis]
MMIEDNKYKISVITAVYNAESCIRNLIESLRSQQDKDFEWVVVDGASTDRTLEILKTINDLNIKIISEPDFGIYDALNKGIKACSGEYYLVAGADDIFFNNAVHDYKKAITSNSELITASIMKNNHKVISKEKWPWLYAQTAYISCHALGVLIRTNLHNQYGFYSNKFPIAADQLFIKKCCNNKVIVQTIDAIVGEFGTQGVSTEDIIGTCTEIFRIQLLTEKCKSLQYLIFLSKILKRFLLSFFHKRI